MITNSIDSVSQSKKTDFDHDFKSWSILLCVTKHLIFHDSGAQIFAHIL